MGSMGGAIVTNPRICAEAEVEVRMSPIANKSEPMKELRI